MNPFYDFLPGMYAWSGRIGEYLVLVFVGVVLGAVFAWWFFK